MSSVEFDNECKVDRPKTPYIDGEITKQMSNLKVKQARKKRTSAPDTQVPLPPLVDGQTVAAKPMYLCVSCDKTYKSKSGVRKHMETCTK